MFHSTTPVAKWLPELPHARDVTLRMLAGMTSGYQDYVADALIDALSANPFRTFTQQELLVRDRCSLR